MDSRRDLKKRKGADIIDENAQGPSGLSGGSIRRTDSRRDLKKRKGADIIDESSDEQKDKEVELAKWNSIIITQVVRLLHEKGTVASGRNAPGPSGLSGGSIRGTDSRRDLKKRKGADISDESDSSN